MKEARMLNQDCSIIVNSCDAYSDLWDSFFYLLHEFWTDVPYEIYLNTETKNYHNEFFKIHIVNQSRENISWSRRLAEALSEIKTPYVITILDDFFPYDYVNTARIEKCIGYLRSNSKIASFCFFPVSQDTVESPYEGFEKRNQNGKFKVLTILSAWNKEKLLTYLSEDENIWEWEANASKRSYDSEDEFYVMRPDEPMIYPYDFRKYGLLGGKWLKDTVALFDRTDLVMDFSKRGFYEDSDRAISTSILKSIELDSSLMPYYALTYEGNPYLHSDNIVKKGKFRQAYNIPGARDIFRWEPSSQYGFVLGRLKCTVHYINGKKSIIRAGNMAGNFVYLRNQLFFIHPDPYVYIFTESNEIISDIVIEGELINPPNRKLLLKAQTYRIVGIPENRKAVLSNLFFEFLISPEKMAYFRTNSRLVFNYGNGYRESDALPDSKKRHAGIFTQRYEIDKSAANTVRWDIADNNGFAIRNLQIELINLDNTQTKLPESAFSGDYTLQEGYYVFLSLSQSVFITLPEEGVYKEIVISGELLCPMPRTILKEIYLPDSKE